MPEGVLRAASQGARRERRVLTSWAPKRLVWGGGYSAWAVGAWGRRS